MGQPDWNNANWLRGQITPHGKVDIFCKHEEKEIAIISPNEIAQNYAPGIVNTPRLVRLLSRAEKVMKDDHETLYPISPRELEIRLLLDEINNVFKEIRHAK